MALAAMFSGLSTLETNEQPKKRPKIVRRRLTPEEKIKIYESQMQAKGLTRYEFGDGRWLYALNRKNAIRKARNNGWI